MGGHNMQAKGEDTIQGMSKGGGGGYHSENPGLGMPRGGRSGAGYEYKGNWR